MKCTVFNIGSREKGMPKSCEGGWKKGVHRHCQAGFDHKTLLLEFFIFFCLTIAKQDLDFV